MYRQSLYRLGLVLLLSFFCLFTGYSQENDSTGQQRDSIIVRVVTHDNNTFLGNLVEQNANFIKLETKGYGVVSIDMDRVKSVKILEKAETVAGEIWTDQPHDARYFWAPAAYNLKGGEGYYQNFWIFFNQFSYAPSDYFTVGVGTIPAFLFGADVFPVWITPKFSLPVIPEKITLGGGVLAATILGEGENFGLIYGNITLGSPRRNFTLGVGYPFYQGDIESSPVYNVNAMLQVGRKSYFITENYIFPGQDFGLIGLGGRTSWFSISLDYGLLFPTGIGEVIGIPLLGVVLPIGQ